MNKLELENKYLGRYVHVKIVDPYHPIDDKGIVKFVDDAGQLFGTWGSLAAIPEIDSIDILNDEYLFAISKDNKVYKMCEGTGDNLLKEDREQGFVDYIYLDIFESLEDALEEDKDPVDGGFVYLEKLYVDYSSKEIIEMSLNS